MYVLKRKSNQIQIECEEYCINCRIRRSRRKTYGIEINQNAEVLLKVPMHYSEAFLFSFVKDKQKWIITKYKQQQKKKEELKQYHENNGLTEVQEQALIKRYREAAKEYIPRRVAYYQSQMGGNYKKVVIRDQKTRWGSCSSRGTLSFNFRLMLAPPKVLDYVVIHELAHLQQMNHSKAFWEIVEETLPDYKIYQKWLKDNGEKLQMLC